MNSMRLKESKSKGNISKRSIATNQPNASNNIKSKKKKKNNQERQKIIDLGEHKKKTKDQQSFKSIVNQFKKLFDQKIQFTQQETVMSTTERKIEKPKKNKNEESVGNLTIFQTKKSHFHLHSKHKKQQGFSQLFQTIEAKLNEQTISSGKDNHKTNLEKNKVFKKKQKAQQNGFSKKDKASIGKKSSQKNLRSRNFSKSVCVFKKNWGKLENKEKKGCEEKDYKNKETILGKYELRINQGRDRKRLQTNNSERIHLPKDNFSRKSRSKSKKYENWQKHIVKNEKKLKEHENWSKDFEEEDSLNLEGISQEKNSVIIYDLIESDEKLQFNRKISSESEKNVNESYSSLDNGQVYGYESQVDYRDFWTRNILIINKSLKAFAQFSKMNQRLLEIHSEQSPLHKMKESYDQSMNSDDKAKNYQKFQVKLEELFREQEDKWLNLKQSLDKMKKDGSNLSFQEELNQAINEAENNHLALKEMEIISLGSSRNKFEIMNSQGSDYFDERQRSTKKNKNIESPDEMQKDKRKEQYFKSLEKGKSPQFLDYSQQVQESQDEHIKQAYSFSLLNEKSSLRSSHKRKKMNININISNSEIRFQSAAKIKEAEVISQTKTNDIPQCIQKPSVQQEKESNVNSTDGPSRIKSSELSNESQKFAVDQLQKEQMTESEGGSKKRKLIYEEAPLQITKLMKKKRQEKKNLEQLQLKSKEISRKNLMEDLELSDFMTQQKNDEEQRGSIQRFKILEQVKDLISVKQKQANNISITLFRQNKNRSNEASNSNLSQDSSEKLSCSIKSLGNDSKNFSVLLFHKKDVIELPLENKQTKRLLFEKESLERSEIQVENSQKSQQEEYETILLGKEESPVAQQILQNSGYCVGENFALKDLLQSNERKWKEKKDGEVQKELFPWIGEGQSEKKDGSIEPHLHVSPCNSEQQRKEKPSFFNFQSDFGSLKLRRFSEGAMQESEEEIAEDFIQDFIITLVNEEEEDEANGQKWGNGANRILNRMIEFYNLKNIQIMVGENNTQGLKFERCGQEIGERQDSLDEEKSEAENNEDLRIEEPEQWDQNSPGFPQFEAEQEHWNQIIEQEVIRKDIDYLLTLADEFLESVYHNNPMGFIKSLMTPLGTSTLDLLRFMRKLRYMQEQGFVDNDEEEDGIQGYQSIISFEEINGFQSALDSTTDNGSQQIFNHSIYDTINLILDEFRPYGKIGLPPLNFPHSDSKLKATPSFPRLKYEVKKKLIDIYEIEAGQIKFRSDFEEQGKVSMNRFLDSFLKEMEVSWKQIEEGEFGCEYEIVNYMEEEILNEEICELWMLMKRA